MNPQSGSHRTHRFQDGAPRQWGQRFHVFGGPDPDRTDDILRARQTLSQLSYRPICFGTHGGIRTPKILILSQTPMPVRLRGHLCLVPPPGVEPGRPRGHRCLRPACLPFPAWRYDYGADSGVRSRGLDLGKVALYQLSYIRIFFGAGDRLRTRDNLITSQVLYQLSYAGKSFSALVCTLHIHFQRCSLAHFR